jgi:hypothetical protein
LVKVIDGSLLLLLPIIDLLQQFEDYVTGHALGIRKILTNRKISLKICTKKNKGEFKD